jgi:hypothetical protein
MTKIFDIDDISKCMWRGAKDFVQDFEQKNKKDIEIIVDDIYNKARNGDKEFLISLGIMTKNNRAYLKDLVKYLELKGVSFSIFHRTEYWLDDGKWEKDYSIFPSDNNIELGVEISISLYDWGTSDKDSYAGYY